MSAGEFFRHMDIFSLTVAVLACVYVLHLEDFPPGFGSQLIVGLFGVCCFIKLSTRLHASFRGEWPSELPQTLVSGSESGIYLLAPIITFLWWRCCLRECSNVTEGE